MGCHVPILAMARRVERNGKRGLVRGATWFSGVISARARWPSAKESLRYWTISALVLSVAGPLAFSSTDFASMVTLGAGCNSVGGSCGFTYTQQQWIFCEGPASFVLATIGDLVVQNNSISVAGTTSSLKGRVFKP